MKKVDSFSNRLSAEDFTSKCMSCHLKRRAFGAKQGEI